MAVDLETRSERCGGFSLVEVSLALGLAAFALVAVLGALPVGLRAIRESQSQEIAANVARRLQASLQQISFSSTGSGTAVDSLASKTCFYTEDGVDTTDPATANSASSPAFYKAVFAVSNPLFSGTTTPGGSAFAQASNACSVTITLWYPQSGQTAGTNKFAYSFLVARQRAE